MPASRLWLPLLALVAAVPSARAAGMDGDPEARALLQHFQALRAGGVALQDDFNRETARRLTGPLTLGPGVKAPADPADKALCFAEDRSEALHAYYGVVLPRRGHLALDFRLATMPRDHNMMTICDAGTAGNTKFMIITV